MKTVFRLAGLVAVLTLSGCPGDDEPPETDVFEYRDRISAKPYRPDSTHAAELELCLWKHIDYRDNCSLERLPTLGMEYGVPTVDEVMDHVVVSHEWMGRRFEQLLSRMPPATLYLMRSLTGVVITSDIRPSFYRGSKGAIYIDPGYLWTTPAERATTPQFADYRSDFSSAIDAVFLWRLVKNNEYATPGRTAEGASRSLEDLEISFAHIIFHELAHAADYFPESIPAEAYRRYNFRSATTEHYLWSGKERGAIDGWFVGDSRHISHDLYQIASLTSSDLQDLAGVRYRHGHRVEPVSSWSAQRVGEEFEADSANHFYSYTSPAEDTAMLIEAVLLYHYYGVRFDIAWTEKPTVEEPTGDDFEVVWGRRGSVGRSDVRRRAALVLQQAIPELDARALVAGLPESKTLVPGRSWLDNLNPDSPGSVSDGYREKVRTRARDDRTIPYH